MLDIFLRFIVQHPVIATVLLVSCPLLAMAIACLLQACGFEMWES